MLRHAGWVVIAWLAATQVGRGQAPKSTGTDWPPVTQLAAALNGTHAIDVAAIAPDGSALAYVMAPALRQTIRRFGDYPASDLWVRAAPRWKPIRVGGLGDAENEGVDGSREALRASSHVPFQFEQPTWSPAGRHLAFLRRRGGQAWLLVWSRSTGRIVYRSSCMRLSEPGLTAIRWIDEGHLTTWGSEDPCDEPDAFGGANEIADAIRAWTSARRRATVSVWRSRLPDSGAAPHSAIWVFAIGSGTRRVVTRGQFDAISYDATAHRVVVFDVVDVEPPVEARLLSIPSRARHRARIAELDGRDSARALAAPSFVIPESVTWSPDGTRVALIAYDWFADTLPCVVAYASGSASPDVSVCMRFGDVSPSRLERDAERSLGVAPANPYDGYIAWLGQHRLVVAGAAHTWYLVAADGAPEAILDSATNVASAWRNAGELAYGIRNGRLVELKLVSESGPLVIREAAPWFMPQLTWVFGATQSEGDVQVWAEGPAKTTYEISLTKHTTKRWSTDRERVRATSEDTSHPSVLLERRDSTGGDRVYLRRTTTSKDVLVVQRREYVPRATGCARRTFDYLSERGEHLTARVTLPPEYDRSRAYPIIVKVYPGATFQPLPDVEPAEFDGGAPDWLSPVFYAQAGFVVVEPSMPYSVADSTSSATPGPIEQLTTGVLPAIDTLVHLGIADSTRIGLIGHSFGGFAVYGLLTRTRRFRAALSAAGIADFADLYGAIEPSVRRRAHTAVSTYGTYFTEAGQGHLLGAPWIRPDAFVSNSPYYHVDHIATPLLIVQGDQDRIPVAQGERMFQALQRLGKKVELVRYWGEDHAVERYFDQLDLARRALSWFRTQLGTGPAETGHAAGSPVPSSPTSASSSP